MSYVNLGNELIGKEITVIVKRNKVGLQEETGIFLGYNGSYAKLNKNGKVDSINYEKIKELKEVK